MQAQPPGPGLPIHDPSVISWTFFMGRSDGGGFKFPLEKSIDLIQDLFGVRGPIDFHPQLGTVSNAVREVSGELFHFSDYVRSAPVAEHAIVRPHDVIALAFRWMLVASSGEVLPDLTEDPRIRGSRPSNHHRVAAGFGDHADGVLRRQDVSVSNDRDVVDGGFDFRDAAPIRFSAVALLASARMQ